MLICVDVECLFVFVWTAAVMINEGRVDGTDAKSTELKKKKEMLLDSHDAARPLWSQNHERK